VDVIISNAIKSSSTIFKVPLAAAAALSSDTDVVDE